MDRARYTEFMTLPRLSGKMMRTTTRFHGNDTPIKLRKMIN
jgi:hypothetical protein